MDPRDLSQTGDGLDEIVADYLESVARGETPDRARLLAEHPELADELRSFFDTHDELASAGRGAVAEHPTLAHPKPQPAASSDAEHPTLGPGQDTTPEGESAQVLTPDRTVQMFGDYVLMREIARGGMGVVYRARQQSLNRIVALKMILAGQLASEQEVQRFHAEASAAARLEHPGIVPIYEVGVEEGQHYFTMAFVDGPSLSQRLAEGPLPPREAADHMIRIGEAVGYAHDEGVVHRDLKPGNILLDRGGEPRVTDFGLAKQVEAGSEITATGQILGTPSYMPPEQAQGRSDDVGTFSDIYSLGAILYEMLTGSPPFRAATPVDTILQVLDRDPVAPRQINARIDRDIETICLKCLHKEPHRRYDSTHELVDDLRRYCEGLPIVARPVGKGERAWRWCRRNPVTAMLSASLVLLLLLSSIGSTTAAVVIAGARERALTAKRDAENNFRQAEAATKRAEAASERALQNEARAESALADSEANFQRALDAVDRMLIHVGTISLRDVPRMEPVRRALLEDALHFYEDFLAERGDDDQLRFQAGVTYSSMGRIYKLLGQFDDSETAFQESIALLEGLLIDEPHDHSAMAALARSVHLRGSLLSDMGRYEESEQDYERSLELFSATLAAHPDEMAFQEEALRSLSGLAALHARLGRYDRAQEAMEKVVSTAETILESHPHHGDVRSILQTNTNNLGHILTNAGDYERGEALLRRSVESAEALLEAREGSATHRESLGAALRTLGVTLDRRDRPEEAEPVFRRALAIFQELSAEFPGEVAYRQDLGRCWNSLAIVLSRQEKMEECAEAYREAISTKRSMVDIWPEAPLYRFELARSLSNFATVLKGMDRSDEAIPLYVESARIARDLQDEYPDVPSHPAMLGAILNDHASLLMDEGDLDLSGPMLQEAIEMHSRAISLNPREMVYRRNLGNSCFELAEHSLYLGDHRAAAEQAVRAGRAMPLSHGMPQRIEAATFLTTCAVEATEDESLDEGARDEAVSNYGDRAMELVAEVIEQAPHIKSHVRNDPRLAYFQDHPRYREVLGE